MFTGIVEELGTVVSREGPRLRIGAETVLDGVALGDSIAVNGCCLTVVAWDDGWWEADVTEETFARTGLGALAPGDPVNLERPVRLQDRLGGHLVQGHVDGVGQVVRPAPDLEVALPADLRALRGREGLDHRRRRQPHRGRALVDGSFTVAVIPHTAAVTTLGRKRPGDTVNLEVDVMAKYAERLLAGQLR